MFDQLEDRFRALEDELQTMRESVGALVDDVNSLEMELRSGILAVTRTAEKRDLVPVAWCDPSKSRHQWPPVEPAPTGPKGGRPQIYPWGRLQPGQGFFVRCAPDRESYFKAQAAKRAGQYVVKPIADGIEIWRIA